MWPSFPWWLQIDPFFLVLSHHEQVLCKLLFSLNVISSRNRRSVTISIFGTPSMASNAVTYIWNDGDKLANKWTTRSSSLMGSPTIDSSSKTFVISLICWWTDCLSFSRKECSFHRTAYLFAHVFFWSRAASLFQTTTGSWGSSSRYNKDGSIDKTTIANALCFLATYLAYFSASVCEGTTAVPLTRFHRLSFINAIQPYTEFCK